MDIVILQLNYDNTHLNIQAMIIIFNDVEIPQASTSVMIELLEISVQQNSRCLSNGRKREKVCARVCMCECARVLGLGVSFIASLTPERSCMLTDPRLLYQSADFTIAPSRKISNTWLSTGWFTMTIALELCDRIDVYGMVPPDFCR